MRFSKKIRKANETTIIVTIPKDIVNAYELNEGDLVEFDLVKNYRDEKK